MTLKTKYYLLVAENMHLLEQRLRAYPLTEIQKEEVTNRLKILKEISNESALNEEK